MAKKQSWSLHSGRNRKAFVFSLDAVIAILVVLSLLAVGTFYITKAGSGEAISNLQMIRAGSDIMALLDNKGTLGELFVNYRNMGSVFNNIEIDLNTILPNNYDMRIKISCNNGKMVAIETTKMYPSDKFLVIGKRVFVNNEGLPCIAEYNIWLK